MKGRIEDLERDIIHWPGSPFRIVFIVDHHDWLAENKARPVRPVGDFCPQIGREMKRAAALAIKAMLVADRQPERALRRRRGRLAFR